MQRWSLLAGRAAHSSLAILDRRFQPQLVDQKGWAHVHDPGAFASDHHMGRVTDQVGDIPLHPVEHGRNKRVGANRKRGPSSAPLPSTGFYVRAPSDPAEIRRFSELGPSRPELGPRKAPVPRSRRSAGAAPGLLRGASTHAFPPLRGFSEAGRPPTANLAPCVKALFRTHGAFDKATRPAASLAATRNPRFLRAKPT